VVNACGGRKAVTKEIKKTFAQYTCVQLYFYCNYREFK